MLLVVSDPGAGRGGGWAPSAVLRASSCGDLCFVPAFAERIERSPPNSSTRRSRSSRALPCAERPRSLSAFLACRGRRGASDVWGSAWGTHVMNANAALDGCTASQCTFEERSPAEL